jgi:Bacterial regulatory protein, arsR family
MKADLIERYAANLHGVLSCFDRILITGTLPGACYARGMTSFLNAHGIRIFDYVRFAEPLRERIRERAQEVCAAAGIEIEHVNKSHIRKEDLVARVLQARGDAPGLVHVISAMEACPSYKPWHDKSSGKTYLRPETGKCLHYYFYFIDDELGLCYLRVPTWAPFGLQFYCNGHGAVARALKREGIRFVQADNAFLRIADVDRAQAIADALSPDMLHERLDRYAQWLCPVLDVFGQTYHWSLRQAEYSTDLMFRSQQTLVPLYDVLSRQAVLAAHAGKVASFLGKKVTPQLAQEIGSRLSTRIEGRCIKHHMGVASVKVYDKFSHVLRIETTINDVSFFKHHRKVEHKNGQSTYELAALRKTIYSLIDLREIMLGCNQRYLAFLSSLDDPSAGERDLQRLSQSRVGSDESRVKGLNFFNGCEQALLRALQRGEFNVHGLRRADLARHVDMSASVLSRQLARLRTLGLIKKVAHTYRYYLTRLGRAAIAAACSLTRFNIVPILAAAH